MNNVLTLRKQKGITQDEFAELCNISRASIARYEAGGNVNRENAERIAEACHVSVDWVIGRPANDPIPASVTGNAKEMLTLLSSLPPEKQDQLLEFGKFLLSSREK